jgi:DNA-directed RNA polymerase specialized sigma24 family protein
MARAAVPTSEREDLWQDVCRDVLEKRASGTLVVDAGIPGLLHTIVSRRISRRRRRKRNIVEKCFGRSDALLSAVPGHDTSEADLLAEILMLCRLSERELLTLKLKGCSIAQIAATLHVSVAEVNRRFVRLRCWLRNLIANKEGN